MTHAILALGSPFGYDRVGWRVAEYLQNFNIGQLHSCRHPIDLIPFFAEHDHCTVIDAVHCEAKTGELVQIDPADFHRDYCLFSQELNLYEVIQLARIAEQLPEHFTLLGINVGMNPKAPLSAEQVASVGQQIAQLLAASQVQATADN